MLNYKIREEAIRLKREEGLTITEISQRLNVPYNTVKSWNFRASSASSEASSENSEKTEKTDVYLQPNQPKSGEFSEEDQQLLSANPYVKSVSNRQIRFTESFREEYWRHCLHGEKPKEILTTMGISPDTLGDVRINGLHKRISDAAASGQLSVAAEERTDTVPDSIIPMRAVVQMRHELAYLRQEVEFIKKTLLVERGKKL